MVDVRLRAWSEAAFDVLRRANTPEMMTYLGGPESAEKLADRQRRYLALDEPGAGQMFLVIADGEPAGVVGYWEHEWDGKTSYEAGWSVLPEFQGRGIAVAALRLVIDDARGVAKHATLHAFPSIHNGASNAVCRKAGMILAGECDFEYPKGNPIRGNDWYLQL
ncbi:MAG TPA: GNAT family N-acetyltransferase [Pseudonocardiaceae bacterium]|jgi:RimJ/RimL family protein N-acetyltransferase|nr:GNAT family N-acetyltransferase [Pseudonocardiaceae bacterium]